MSLEEVLSTSVLNRLSALQLRSTSLPSIPLTQEKLTEFETNGFCVIKDVIDVEKIHLFRTRAMKNFQEILDEISAHGKKIGIGIKEGFKEIVQRHAQRYEIPYRMIEIGALDFADSPLVKELAGSILGPDFQIVSVSLVVSGAGAQDQGWHTDGPHMSIGEHLPCHCFNLFIPLVDVDLSNGPTSFRPEVLSLFIL
jgi:ectoine hydroxylase-related dioxygenase (phytanoyl-CoA dioxygenase family)